MAHKFEKRKYHIVGYFEQARKYGLSASRMVVEGYFCKEIPGIAVRKDGKMWYLDHIASGYSINLTGYKTREDAVAAAKTYADKLPTVKEKIEAMKRAKMGLYDESFLEEFKTISFTTIKDRKMQMILDKAKYYGCIIRKNEEDHGTYLHGGSVQISGTDAMLRDIIAQINYWNQPVSA